MFKITHKIILETMVVFILTVISITSFYATFLPDTKFLFFEESYLEYDSSKNKNLVSGRNVA